MNGRRCRSWAKGVALGSGEVHLCQCNLPVGHSGMHIGYPGDGQMLAWENKGSVNSTDENGTDDE